jgi:hypothetical protein
MSLVNSVKMKALLVAEESVLPVLRHVIDGLLKWGIAEEVFLVVPARQLDGFAHLGSSRTQVIPEEEVIGNFSLGAIGDRLGPYRWRAGWYLQQFVKLGFARITRDEHYVIWDADTIPLEPIDLVKNGRCQINVSKEFHPPYFQVIRELLRLDPVLRFSVISQYMTVATHFAVEMLDRIEQIHEREWIDAVLAALPLKGQSEFSEYETYGNFMAVEHPSELEFVRHRWFRNGSDILELHDLPTNEQIERVFAKYSYVSFERRTHAGWKRLMIKALLTIRASS